MSESDGLVKALWPPDDAGEKLEADMKRVLTATRVLVEERDKFRGMLDRAIRQIDYMIAEREGLEAVIANAPHASECAYLADRDCDCWKSRAHRHYARKAVR